MGREERGEARCEEKGWIARSKIQMTLDRQRGGPSQAHGF
jgi:hypothetical protein